MVTRGGDPGDDGPDGLHDPVERVHEHAPHDHPAEDGGGLGYLHEHAHATGYFGRLKELVAPHSHDSADKVDTEMETSRKGVQALWRSLVILAATAAVQAVVVALSGSVALLGDTLHNFADALTAVPLGVAFWAGRRPPNRSYTYGYGRLEDLAGIVVVLMIAASSVLAAYAAIVRLLHPHSVSELGAVAGAAVVGFVGNEVVAHYRIRVGRQIGSAALIADGMHARTDGLTSLAVLAGAIGVAAGWRDADPAVGLVITVAILFVVKSAAREVFRRLMDAVDPAIVGDVEETLRSVPGVMSVGQVRVRWIGHALRAEAEVVVDEALSIGAAHTIAEEARHELLHKVRRLTSAIVHADPSESSGLDWHAALDHHDPF
jgi:cation diffusion facilitator family transporter